MIRHTDLSAIAAALRIETYRFVGVRPLETSPSADGACVVLAEPNLTALDMALQEALAMWPHCEDWELIGSDVEIRRTAQSHPQLFASQPEAIMTPRGRILERPRRMATFHLDQ